jgi:hypothetical protein
MIKRLALLLALPAAASAQSEQSSPNGSRNGSGGGAPAVRDALPPLPSLSAVRLDGSIRIDGRLDEAAWSQAKVGTGFIQVDPDNGQPATEQTEVRVLYDDQAIYIGARMFDSEPDKIRARLARRDESVSNADLIEISIDSYLNRVDGYIFRITAAGAIRDAAVLASGGQDNSWDAVWQSEARVDSLGWVAEIRIPFSQLRYDGRDGPQAWGIQIGRTVPRRNEISVFSFTPRHAQGGPQRWATLENLEDLPRARYLELLPYVTGRAEYLHVAPDNPFRSASEYKLKGGADLKYGLSSSLTLSATVNPDFGQVEVDPARVNLSANELFFPERRPFFVEGADLFRYGRIRSFNNRGMPTIFHSRRVGRAPQRQIHGHPHTDMPEEATIAGAVKLTGRMRNGVSAGLLNAFTLRETAAFESGSGVRGSEPVEPATNYLAGRLRRDMNRGNTQFGLMGTAVNRDLRDSVLTRMLRGDAYFMGADFNQFFRERRYSLDASFGYSSVHGSPRSIAATQRSPVHYFQRPDLKAASYDSARTSLQGYSWQLAAAKNAGKRSIGSLAWQGVSPGFEVNDMGFQSSTAYNQISSIFGIKSDDPGRYTRNWLVGPFMGHGWNFDGDMTEHYYGLVVEGRLLNFWSVNTQLTHAVRAIDDRLTRGGPAIHKPSRTGVNLNIGSDPRKIYTLWFGGGTDWFESGRRASWGWAEFSIRPSSALRVSIAPNVDWSRYTEQYLTAVADTSATATYGRRYAFGQLDYRQLAIETRVDWTFSPRLSLQLFAQPLIADGEYSNFKTLARARSYDFDRYTEQDGTLTHGENGWTLRPAGAGATNITVGDPNFSSRSLVGNAVVRWEYRPGSALFFVWQQRRAGDDGVPGFAVSRDLRNVFNDRPENVFAVKATYWLGR